MRRFVFVGCVLRQPFDSSGSAARLRMTLLRMAGRGLSVESRLAAARTRMNRTMLPANERKRGEAPQ